MSTIEKTAEFAQVEKGLEHIRQQAKDRIDGIEAIVHDLAQKSADGFSPSVLGKTQHKSFGQQFMETQQAKDLMSGHAQSAKATLTGASLLVKNTISGDTGSPATPDDVFSPASRLPYISEGPTKNLRLVSAMPVMTADSNQVAATREAGYTNSAAGQTAEGSAKAESTLTFDLVQRQVVTIAHFVKCSNQVLQDAPALQNYIDRRLAYGLMDRLEFEILRGDGTAGSFDGMQKAGNHTAITPETGDAASDTIRKAITALELAGYEASAIVLNPADFAAIEIEKASTGLYILGDGGSARLVTEGLARRMWSVPVILSTHLQAGKVVVADLGAAAVLWDRQSPTIEMGFVNSDFTNNLITLRAEMRGALTINQPVAIRYGDLTV